MFEHARNSKKQGDAGLGAAIAWASSYGFGVLLPLTDSEDYDFVYDDGSCLKRVQVRTSTYKRNGRHVVSLKVMGGNRSGGSMRRTTSQLKYDELFVLTDDGDMYLIPKTCLPETSLDLGKRVEQFRVKLSYTHR